MNTARRLSTNRKMTKISPNYNQPTWFMLGSYPTDLANPKLSDIPIAVMGMTESDTISSIHCHKLGRTTSCLRLMKLSLNIRCRARRSKPLLLV